MKYFCTPTLNAKVCVFIRYVCLKIFFISRRALAREGDYEMMPVCA